MATMVKEKRREKKKTKQKHEPKPVFIAESTSAANLPIVEEIQISKVAEVTLGDESKSTGSLEDKLNSETVNVIEKEINLDSDAFSKVEEAIPPETGPKEILCKEKNVATEAMPSAQSANAPDHAYTDLNLKLERMCIPVNPVPVSKEREFSMGAESAYLVKEVTDQVVVSTSIVPLSNETLMDNASAHIVSEMEDISPSAPTLEYSEPQVFYQEEVIAPEVPKLTSLPLEEAIRVYGGAEMAEVMAMSEREEAIVEAGDMSGPEHPLVDFLSTFKRSLIALERERIQLSVSFAEEEKYRNSLWKIEKQYINHYEKCKCGEGIFFKATYEHAEFQKDKLPVARMKLESIMRDVQDSYCLHQHSALLAHCQIEEFISEVVVRNKSEIREALSLVLQALKLSDNAPGVLSSALRRWAAALAAALVDRRDPRQLLFLLHHLFRQTRSVRWAASVVDLSAPDHVSTARVIALLDVLLTRPPLECAVECTEDKDEEWEEVGKDGGGGAVSDGSLRERDMLALLRAFPLRELVARLALVTQADISQSRAWQWGDASGGRDVLRACCGARALLDVLCRAARAHAHYARLRRALRHVALCVLRALAAVLEENWHKELEVPIQAELEAAFVAGLDIMPPSDAHRLPASLLSWHAARDYCSAHIDNLHGAKPVRVESLSLALPALECGARVVAVASAAGGRRQDLDLARLVLQFLFQTGVRRNTASCKGACRQAARDALPSLLNAHPHLYEVALRHVADTSQVEKLEPSSISCLAVDRWRPQPHEAYDVAFDWSQRCPHLLPALLLNLDYTPHTGISLDAQLGLGGWLCSYVRSLAPAEPDDWCWRVLRALRLHRSTWGLRPEAPPPDPEPDDLFSKAYALMQSSWGHCIPLICSSGVAALCSLAAARAQDAVHCLAPLMLVLVDSPESVASTSKFTDLFSLILGTGGLVARALGRGSPGAALLARLVHEQLAGDSCGGVPHSALVRVWICALWRPAPGAAALLDAALRPRDLWQLNEFAQHQNEDWVQQMSAAIRASSSAPLLCYAALGAWLVRRELAPALLPRLEAALLAQRAGNQRIHVANALNLIGSSTSAEDLVIYKTAAAILGAPMAHFAHLLLWALLMQLYLSRGPGGGPETPAVGPLFFSGIIKSRTLAQLKRRLQDSIKYHQSEQKRLASENPEPTTPAPNTSRIVKSESRSLDGQLMPLSINDLTCESSDSSESDDSEEERVASRRGSTEENDVYMKNVKLAIKYHAAAESMLGKYAEWLDAGDAVRARQADADVSRLLPERLQEAMWEVSARSRATTPLAEREPLPLPPPAPEAPPPAPATPYDTVVRVLMDIKNMKPKRSRRPAVKSPVDKVDFKDIRSLLSLVESHCQDLQKLAKESNAEVSTLANLNIVLWKLVQEQRVAKPLPVMRKYCSQRCAQVTYAPSGHEWCIAVGAVQGIKENRAKAMACTRRLARPRPHAARTAAALFTIVRRIPSREAAGRVAELALEAAARAGGAAAVTLAAFVEQLAERWLSSDGVLCSYLIRRSYNNSAAQTLIGPLVAPPRVDPAHIPTLHSALLRGPLPPSALFSYLSRFDMSRWADTATPAQRSEVLNELTEAAQRWAARDEPDYQVLLELVGMQSAAACRASELAALASGCCRAAAAWLPPAQLSHVARAALLRAPGLPCDQLGHLLRELGVIWWEVRSGLKGPDDRYAAYAPHVAQLLSVLHRAFVAAAVQLSYAPERVAALAWSSLLEAWSAWVVPHAAPPLLPSTGEREHYTCMLRAFHEAALEVMADCPGTEEHLLCQIFEWAVQTCASVHSAPNQESRVQASALLAELARGPWRSHQWLRASSLQALLQVCHLGDRELNNWCAAACDGLQAYTWAGREAELGARLPLLLHLFTAGIFQNDRVLEEATRLPWQRLPEPALEEALERFFAQHYSLAVPYHELPQFRVLLYAAELRWPPESLGSVSVSGCSRQKRGRLVSTWVRSASAPPLAPHVAPHTRALLGAIGMAAPHLTRSEGEVEELLSRAMVIMCIESAATAALSVWEQWVQTAPPLLSRAAVYCVHTLTAYEPYAALADACVRAYFSSPECPGWSSIAVLWRGGHWRDASPLCARARLHAAYVTLAAHDHAPSTIRAALLALLAAEVDFIEHEVIVAVWICATCRLVRELSFEAAEGEARAAAHALLTRCAEPPRRSLLQLVSLQASKGNPTQAHRLLSLFALCVLSPTSTAEARAFEAACGTVQGLGPDVANWGRAPHPKRLPRLAMRLYPNHEKYFREELDMVPEENT